MHIIWHIQQFICLAGIAQICLAAGSLAIPAILNWKTELATVQPLIKQMFWTYAAYILVINLGFGLISLFDYAELINGSYISMLLTGFIAVYWISRILIQFLYFDRKYFPTGKWYILGEIALNVLFLFLSTVYTAACYTNYLKS